MIKNILKYREVFVTLAVFAVFLLPVVVAAQNPGTLPGSNQGTLPGSNPGVAVPTAQSSHVLQNPLAGGVNSVCGLVIALLRAVTIIGIPIAVLFIVWAGFKFVLAQGSGTKIKEARDNLVAVLIGIAIFVGASLIANVIVNTLQDLGVRGINSCT
ncbi:MAG: Uncharacterized protein G01um101456_87 [Parcubacteria group bacterium Gr01-1014_56]|nr:MAG: Uncharacterized protein G01um101456_87 [Parcubacteria group bacterium Gr01-1014_56]